MTPVLALFEAWSVACVSAGMGWHGMGWDGMGWDGMGWDGMGWDGMGWDGMEWDVLVLLCALRELCVI